MFKSKNDSNTTDSSKTSDLFPEDRIVHPSQTPLNLVPNHSFESKTEDNFEFHTAPLFINLDDALNTTDQKEASTSENFVKMGVLQHTKPNSISDGDKSADSPAKSELSFEFEPSQKEEFHVLEPIDLTKFYEDESQNTVSLKESVDKHISPSTNKNSKAKPENINSDQLAVESPTPKEKKPASAAETPLKTEPPPKEKSYEWAFEESLQDKNEEYNAISPKAMQFPFELDSFQKQAILHLEKRESVFVAAHTSAGKTVIAEYAIALSISHLTRAIYTSPIKTLSNQKFRDFKKEFGDVGIVTGDVSINPDASCLILTTEIFRSILYKGSEIIRDIEWVIFDEVHYINDYERGVVWEEVIIMLPDHINIIMLSATVPNALEFANWVGLTKRKNIFVISTHKRPVPLKHYIYHQSKFYCVMEEEKLHSKVFDKIKKANAVAKVEKNSRYGREKIDWKSFVQQLNAKELLPVVVFVFSRRKCDIFANLICKNNFNNKGERGKIRVIVNQALKRLTQQDKELPQVMKIMMLLENGIGIHHAGMLPIVKEMVEMCFARGLVKVLFATETFALGVNMPARTVAFESYEKHDGRSFRFLKSGEYVQMSGRAGRRGLDEFGTVIIIGRQKLVEDRVFLIRILSGEPDPLKSKFRVTYNMILNLFKTEDVHVEDVIKKSFDQFHSQKSLPDHVVSLKKHSEKLALLQNAKSAQVTTEVEEYLALFSEIRNSLAAVVEATLRSDLAAKMFAPGCVVLIKNPTSVHNAYAVILKVVHSSAMAASQIDNIKFVGLIFTPEQWGLKSKKISFSHQNYCIGEIALGDETRQYFVNEIYVKDILCLTDLKFKIKSVSDLMIKHDEKTIKILFKKLEKKLKKSKTDPLQKFLAKNLNNVGFFGSSAFRVDEEITNALDNIEKLGDFDFNGNLEFLEQFYKEYAEKRMIKDEVKTLKFLLSDDSIHLIEIFERKISVLTDLNFVSRDRSVLIKGHVACEINNCNSLILTEVIFENVLKDLCPEDILALLSCLLFQHKERMRPQMTAVQKESLESLFRVAQKIGMLQERRGLDMPADEFVEKNLNEGLMEVVYLWSKGEEFKKICRLTPVQEGSIVRNIVRLDETCRDIKNAARVIGDPELFRKMETASALIKRDIIFTASLYLV